MAARGPGGGDAPAPRLPDVEELANEILARKGPAKYTGGLSEDTWEEELENIPLFMTRPPEVVDAESAPALAALQDIKYNEETPYGRALALKEDGNEQFKKKRYKTAITAYSAGLKEKAEDRELVAILYCNRAAAQYHLKNFRSALSDATEAVKSKPDHMKAILRGAECCIQLGRFADSVEWCDKGLRIDSTHGCLRELRKNAVVSKKKEDKGRRREATGEIVRERDHQNLLEVIKSRGIHVGSASSNNQECLLGLLLQVPHPSINPVRLSAGDELVWPVVLLYPEFAQTDFIAAFNENSRFLEQLEEVFQNSLPWDKDGKYRLNTVELYYEGSDGNLHPVPLDHTLKSALSSESYVVTSATPSFIVLSTASSFRQHFLSRT